MEKNYKNSVDSSTENAVLEIYRYLNFWPYYLISFLVFLSVAFIYLRYADYQYSSVAKIEIIDKAQDSEMVLPSAMTIFNRSMINLENEIGVFSSYKLHGESVKSLKSNFQFFTLGRVKTTQNHHSEWFPDYELEFNIKPDEIITSFYYDIVIEKDKMNVFHYDANSDLIKKYSFDSHTTTDISHNLPFNLTINDYVNSLNTTKRISFLNFSSTVEYFRNSVSISEVGTDSDQLEVRMLHTNRIIANDYLNSIISEFDKDGIKDRQQEYSRTIDFVNSRSTFLIKELELIENKKQKFKEVNKLSDIESDAKSTIAQKYTYNSELFEVNSQRDLAILLNDVLNNNKFQLMPVNIGLENQNINLLISQYNSIIKDRDRFLVDAGPNNLFIKNLEDQLADYSKNISISIDNYIRSLDITINNLEQKEEEFSNIYEDVPENEKILRSIERELEVKEALFLLLLQKKEEASINFAVVKPSIKIIDNAKSSNNHVSPDVFFVYLSSIFSAFFLPTILLYIRFVTDTKIHTRDQLLNNLPNIPIVGEVPYVEDQSVLSSILPRFSRNPLVESIRMVIANLNFVLFDNDSRNNLILVTSSVKGEGKTIVSVNTASALSSKYDKILLIGADLRNPQIHKFLGISKDKKGLSDYIYLNDASWKDFIIKNEKLDILLSGTIPPNPTELLSSKKFESLLNELSKIYDYIIIDSAPCLLVSDTFEISKHVNTTLYVVRSNFTDNKLCSFINETCDQKKLTNINLVLNSVGNSQFYGYKYGYQYGYKYGYKYGYNYGYGYGYSEEKD